MDLSRDRVGGSAYGGACTAHIDHFSQTEV
jgi:hypothetical protein